MTVPARVPSAKVRVDIVKLSAHAKLPCMNAFSTGNTLFAVRGKVNAEKGTG